MPNRLVVNDTNELKEVSLHSPDENPYGVRLLARFISYVFHPVFVPVYIILFLLYIHPGVFAGFSENKKFILLVQSFVGYVFFPVITVLLLRALKFIESIYLLTRRDRIIPFVACGIWYFWTWYVWKNLPGSPHEIVVLSMGIFLASSFGLMANIYMKISMHAIAMGIMVCFLFLLGLTQAVNLGLYIAAALLIAGLVCTSRFIASNHTAKEIYGGLLTGIISLLLSHWFQ